MQNDEYTFSETLKHEGPLLVAAVFVVLFLIARASVQSITIDEAISYLDFAAQPGPAHWYPDASNHVLNTALARLFTSIFGISAFTIRIPALIGAVYYAFLCIRLCRLFLPERLSAVALFICLTCNPFVQDYLVAGRGYSLALAFFTAVLLILVRVCTERCASAEKVIAASICAGLSICSNFSFAFANAIAILSLLCCCWRVPGLSRKSLVAGALLPGIAATILICGYTLQHFPKDQLYHGANNLKKMAKSILAPSFDEPNPFLINPLLISTFRLIRVVLPPAFLVLLLPQLVMAVLRRAVLPTVLCGMLVGTILLHWLAFSLFHLLLPSGRTGLFFAPLVTILLAALASPIQSGATAVLRRATIIWFVAAAIYFIGCLRLSYFYEWKFDADMRAVYFKLEELNGRQPLENACIDWRCAACINFYSMSHGGTLPHFDRFDAPMPGRSVYVLMQTEHRPFIESQHLQIIYKGEISDVVIALSTKP